MKHDVFPNSPNSEYHTFEGGDCLFVNPITRFQEKLFSILYHIYLLKNSNKFHSVSQRLTNMTRAKVLAKQSMIREYNKIIDEPIQDELKMLLLETKKKKQQALLKTVSFNSSLLVALPIYAYKTHKMPYSSFKVDHLPKELDGKVQPAFLRVEGEVMEHLGFTDMTKGEMRNAIEKRNVIISDFIGDETTWHCFFRTIDSIRGTEQPHEGFSHIHYISSAWGIPREQVVQQLTSYRYSLKAETIPFDNAVSYD